MPSGVFARTLSLANDGRDMALAAGFGKFLIFAGILLVIVVGGANRQLVLTCSAMFISIFVVCVSYVPYDNGRGYHISS